MNLEEVRNMVDKQYLNLKETTLILTKINPQINVKSINQIYASFITQIYANTRSQRDYITCQQFLQLYNRLMTETRIEHDRLKIEHAIILHKNAIFCYQNGLRQQKIEKKQFNYYEADSQFKLYQWFVNKGVHSQLASTIKTWYHDNLDQPFTTIKTIVQRLKNKTTKGTYSYNQYIQQSLQRTQILKVCGWDHLLKIPPKNFTPQYLAILIFNLQFQKAWQIIQSAIKNIKDIDIKQSLYLIKPGLTILKQIQQELNQNAYLKDIFIRRKEWQIRMQELQHIPQKQKQFCLKIEFIKGQLSFVQNFFSMLQFNDHYLKLIKIFLSNLVDRKSKSYSIQLSQLENIQFYDKIAFLVKYFQKQDGLKILQNLFQELKNSCKLNSFCVFGPSQQYTNIVQNYVDETNDLQTAAVLTVVFRKSSFPLKQQYINSYLQILDRLQLQRKKIDFQSAISKHQNLVRRGSSPTLLCGNCNIAYNSITRQQSKNTNQIQFNNYCLKCQQMTPICSVCLLPISTFNPYAEKFSKRSAFYTNVTSYELIVWCMKCKHGGHYPHLAQWFQQQERCPIGSCQCYCRRI